MGGAVGVGEFVCFAVLITTMNLRTYDDSSPSLPNRSRVSCPIPRASLIGSMIGAAVSTGAYIVTAGLRSVNSLFIGQLSGTKTSFSSRARLLMLSSSTYCGFIGSSRGCGQVDSCCLENKVVCLREPTVKTTCLVTELRCNVSPLGSRRGIDPLTRTCVYRVDNTRC